MLWVGAASCLTSKRLSGAMQQFWHDGDVLTWKAGHNLSCALLLQGTGSGLP